MLSATLDKLFYTGASVTEQFSGYQPCGWEGNRKSGVGLATCYRHLWAEGLGEGGRAPAYAV